MLQVNYIVADARVRARSAYSGIAPRSELTAGTVWGLGRISHRRAGIATYAASAPSSTRIYMLDTGVLLTHPEFGGRAVWGANFVEGSPVGRPSSLA
jgi:subtilisin family serine protease